MPSALGGPGSTRALESRRGPTARAGALVETVGHAVPPTPGFGVGCRRYASWVDRHRKAILGVSFLIALVAGWLTTRLPIQADLS